MLRVASNFTVTLAAGRSSTCAQAVKTLLQDKRSWEVRSAGQGSKGQRWYAWAWIATASPRHCLLLRRHLKTGELAFSLLPRPRRTAADEDEADQGRRTALASRRRFRIREGLASAGPVPGTALYRDPRHIVLVMAALAICAVTAALLRTCTDTQAPPPNAPGQAPPADPGMIPLTVPEIRRILAALTARPLPPPLIIHWDAWTRSHQARARWFHQRARLKRDYALAS